MYQTNKIITQESNTHVEYTWELRPERPFSCNHKNVSWKQENFNRYINEDGNSVTTITCPKCEITMCVELVDKRKI
jgi:hypothetical protein